MDTKKTVLVTGAAGYVGAMVVNELAKREDVTAIIGLDKDPVPDLIKGLPKLVYIQRNTAGASWQEEAEKYAPSVVIHTAWQIRCFYGNPAKAWKWNVTGSKRVFEFAFRTPSVERLVHFSTASIYGAYKENALDHRFREEEPMREKEYLYGVEKKQAELDLRHLFDDAKASQARMPQVSIVRPAAITGPRGRAMTHRFGLQSALSGTLTGSPVYKLIRLMVSFVPSTPGWCRQFVHEDDVTDIAIKLGMESHPWDYEVFNLAPPGPPVLPRDMARAVGKRSVRVPVFFIRFAYFLFWHLTRGKIPTAPGSWRFYSYPIVMDGSKAERLLAHRYRMESNEAFVRNEGRYAA